MLVGPLDAAGGVDGEDGVLQAVDHRGELIAAAGGCGEGAVDLLRGAGERTGKGVEVAEALVVSKGARVLCRISLGLRGDTIRYPAAGQRAGRGLEREDAGAHGLRQ